MYLLRRYLRDFISPLFFSLLKMIGNILNLHHFPEKCSQEPRRKIKIQIQFKTENLGKVSLADKGRERKENRGEVYSSHVDRYNSQVVDYPEKAITCLQCLRSQCADLRPIN